MLFTSNQFMDSVGSEVEMLLERDVYNGSPLESFRRIASGNKGGIFEKFVEIAAKSAGATVKKMPYGSSFDLIINGTNSEVKGSTLNVNYALKNPRGAAKFKWQQLRPNSPGNELTQKFIFVAAYPDTVELYEATYEDVDKHIFQIRNKKGGWKYAQHGGSKNKQDEKAKNKKPDTFWVQGLPEDFPWMKKVQF